MQARTLYIWLGAAAVLFTGLLLVRTLVDASTGAGPDMQSAYSKLASVLQTEGLVPGERDESFMMELAGQTGDYTKVHPQRGLNPSGDILSLANVIEARTRMSEVEYVKLRPGYRHELLPGALANELRRVSGYSQRDHKPDSSTGKVKYTVTVNGTSYDVEPQFNGNKLDEIIFYRK